MPLSFAAPGVGGGARLSAQRVWAILEVLVVFAVAHVLMRWFKQYSRLGALEHRAGLNFSPGLCLAGVAVLILLATRRDLRGCGFRVPGCLHDRTWLSPRRAVAVAVLYLCPLLLFLHLDSRTGHALLNYVGFVSTVSFGEEIFFRGYMQSRLNEVFGKPFALRGIRFGAGLVVANLVFGLIHGLNTVDYFHGQYTFHWWWAAGSMVPGFCYGLIREATDSVWPGALVHGLWDIWTVSLWALWKSA